MIQIRHVLLCVWTFVGTIALGQAYFSATYNTAAPLGNTRDFTPAFSTRGFGIETPMAPRTDCQTS